MNIMLKLAMTLLILVSAACSSGGSGGGGGAVFRAGVDYEYAGQWTGPLTMTVSNPAMTIPCTSQWQFSQPVGFFNIDQGDIDCNGNLSNLGPSQLQVINNDLYISGNKVGQISGTNLSFTYVDIGGTTLTFELTPTSLNTMTVHTTANDGATLVTINGTITRQ